jgi:hypothetical protein
MLNGKREKGKRERELGECINQILLVFNHRIFFVQNPTYFFLSPCTRKGHDETERRWELGRSRYFLKPSGFHDRYVG